MNYAQLTQLVQQYCATTESSFVANIPTFVNLAEERIYNSVQIPAIRRNSTSTVTSEYPYVTLPSDWLATFSLAVIDPITNGYNYLLDKDANFIRASYPDPTSTGLPKYYAQFDVSSLILAPTPDDSYAVELNYYYYPESLVTAGTTWLSENFETVLLYGTIREAYLYLKGEVDLTAMYEQKYQEALGLLKILGDGKNRRDAYRSGQTRVPVP
jgi:hypothetical protein